MARFPIREAEIVALAQSIINGLTQHTADFPSPPPDAANLSAMLAEFNARTQASIQAEAVAQQAHAAKDEAQQELTDIMRNVLRYAETTANGDDAKLKLLGWGGKAERTSLQVPGQPRSLEASRQGPGWVFLDWKEPIEGGKPAAYKVQRRERPNGDWSDIGTAITSELTLTDQPRGKDWEFRILALNRAGESEPSNTVEAVL